MASQRRGRRPLRSTSGGFGPRAMASVFLLAAIAASCGSSNDGTTTSGDQAPQSTAAPAASDTASDVGVDLGRLELGHGSGSLAVAVSERLTLDEALDVSWTPFAQPVEVPASCRFGEPLAAVGRIYANFATSESIGVRVNLYATEAEAQAALAEYAGSPYERCSDEAFDQLRGDLQEGGIYDGLEVTKLVDQATLLADRDGVTRRADLQLTGAGGPYTLHQAETAFVDGVAFFGVEVVLAENGPDSGHAELTELAADSFSWEADVQPDPELDAAVNRLRAAVPASENQARYFDLFQSAIVRAPANDACGGLPAGRAELAGPTWATGQGISALFHLGQSYDTTEAAEAALAAAVRVDTSCRYEQIRSSLSGELTFVDAEVAERTIDGRTVVVTELNLTQQPTPNAIEIDVVELSALTRSGAEIVGWRFLGIKGDEPDLGRFALESAIRLETAAG